MELSNRTHCLVTSALMSSRVTQLSSTALNSPSLVLLTTLDSYYVYQPNTQRISAQVTV